MTLEWLGHSCFLMTTSAGTKALMDPYGKFLGYAMPSLEADVVTSRQGARYGPSIVFVFEADGLRVCHCGDLGHELDEKRLKEIGGVDIPLVPCGAFASAGSEPAARLGGRLGPAIAIPMHYRTRALGAWGLLFSRVDGFVRACGLPAYREGILQATSETLIGAGRIVILDWEYRKHAQR